MLLCSYNKQCCKKKTSGHLVGKHCHEIGHYIRADFKFRDREIVTGMCSRFIQTFGNVPGHVENFAESHGNLSQALTTPLARLPGIARNGCRATVFVGRSCPAKLVFWKFGQQTFFCIKHQLSVHPMRSWVWEVICKVTIKVNQFLFVISMISSPLYSIWLYDQLGITPWFELSMT